MRLPLNRLVLVASLLPFLAGPLSSALRADLVWTRATGWTVEGGALSGLAGAEGRNALDQMNKARLAEDEGSNRSAIRTYQAVAKKYPNSIYAPEALYRSARLRLKGQDYAKAFEDFQSVLGRYPNTRRFNEIVGEQYRIASAMLDGARGRMLWGTLPGFTQRDKALEFFETILGNAPYSDYAPLSLMNIARGHQKLGNTENAIDALLFEPTASRARLAIQRSDSVAFDWNTTVATLRAFRFAGELAFSCAAPTNDISSSSSPEPCVARPT